MLHGLNEPGAAEPSSRECDIDWDTCPSGVLFTRCGGRGGTPPWTTLIAPHILENAVTIGGPSIIHVPCKYSTTVVQ